MKKSLIILLFPAMICAQQKTLPLSYEQVKMNYDKIDLGRKYKARLSECETEFDLLLKDVGSLKDSIISRNKENKELRQTNAGLYDESLKLMYDNGALNQQIKDAGKWWNRWYTYAVAAVSFYLGTKIK